MDGASLLARAGARKEKEENSERKISSAGAKLKWEKGIICKIREKGEVYVGGAVQGAGERRGHCAECQHAAGALHGTRSTIEGAAWSAGEWRGHCMECGRATRALHGVRADGRP